MSELPKGWADGTTVEDVAEIRSGNGFPKKYQGRPEGELPFFKVGDISRNWQKGQITLAEAEHYISRDDAKEIRAKTLPEGSVVFAKIGAAVALNRRAILATEALVDNNVMGLVPTDATTSRFLFYYMCQVDLGTATRGGAVPSLRKGDVGSLDLPLPPLPEQRRIVARIEELFSRLDAGVAALRHAKAQLQRYRQSVLAAAVTGQLTQAWREQHPATEPASDLLERILEQRRAKWTGRGKYKEPSSPDQEGLPTLPEPWIWTRIDAVTDMMSGHAFKKAEYSEEGVRLFQIANVSFGATKWAEVEHLPEDYLEEWSQLELKEGDILMALNRPLLSGRLKIARLAKRDVPAILYQRVGKFIFNLESVSDFFMLYMQSKHYINRLEAQLQGVNIPFINKGKLLDTPFPLPPLAEQHQIVAEVEARTTGLDHLEAELDRQITRAQVLRNSTLQAAFSGRLVDQDPSDEPAGKLLEQIRKERAQMPKKKSPKKKATRKRRVAVRTTEDLVALVNELGGKASPEQLLIESKLEDDVDSFFELLRDAQGTNSLHVPVGEFGEIKTLNT